MTEANRCVGGGLIIVEFAPLLTPEGLRRVQEFIQSLNVYGTTPFLYPIYGGGDVLQSFCRINNVYAGITMLQTDVVGVVTKEEKVVGVEAPNFVELEVTQTDPGFKGNTATNVTKPAIVETGAEIKVPLFINPGDRIKIDTRNGGEYLERCKG